MSNDHDHGTFRSFGLEVCGVNAKFLEVNFTRPYLVMYLSGAAFEASNGASSRN